MTQAPDPARPTTARPGVGDLVAGAASAVFGAAVVVYAQGFPELRDGSPGPGLFPSVVGALLVLFGVVLVARSLWRRTLVPAGDRTTRRVSKRGLVDAGLVLASIVVYLLVADLLGTVLTLAVLLFLLSWRLGAKLVVALGTAVLVPALVYLVFQRILLVPLPAGLLGYVG